MRTVLHSCMFWYLRLYIVNLTASELPIVSRNVTENSGHGVLCNCLPKILSRFLYIYLHPPSVADEVSGNLTASHWHSWFIWWSDTLWATITRLWLQHSCVYFGLGITDVNGYTWSVIVELALTSQIYVFNLQAQVKVVLCEADQEIEKAYQMLTKSAISAIDCLLDLNKVIFLPNPSLTCKFAFRNLSALQFPCGSLEIKHVMPFQELSSQKVITWFCHTFAIVNHS
jgi:hypothetical protein